jgi:pyruvate dehydrogenase E2 component (dihydrolipoamide acetyltransferase)
VTATHELLPLPPAQILAARRLSRSYDELVHATVTAEAEATPLVEWRAAQAPASRPTCTVLLLRLLGQAVRRHPQVNVACEGEQQRCYRQINIGVATASRDGSLLVPVVHDADRLGIPELAARLAALRGEIASGRVSRASLSGATITLSNVGMLRSVRFASPIIPHGTAAIVVAGALHRAASIDAAADGGRPRWLLPLSLAFDHRVLNGMPAAGFLQTLVDLIESVPRSLGAAA